jgi:hypothetical protein
VFSCIDIPRALYRGKYLERSSLTGWYCAQAPETVSMMSSGLTGSSASFSPSIDDYIAYRK